MNGNGAGASADAMDKHMIQGPTVQVDGKDERIQGPISEEAWKKWQAMTPSGISKSTMIEGLVRMAAELKDEERNTIYFMFGLKEHPAGKAVDDLLREVDAVLSREIVSRLPGVVRLEQVAPSQEQQPEAKRLRSKRAKRHRRGG